MNSIDIMSQYFKDIEGEEYNPISNDEIKELVKIAQAGYDKEKKEWKTEEAIEARNEIVKRNIRLVPYVIHKVIKDKKSNLFLECVNECHYAIVKCVVGYDTSDDCATNFATYAQISIRRHAWRFLRENANTVKLPSAVVSKISKSENEIYATPGALDRVFKGDFKTLNHVVSLDYDYDDGEKNHRSPFKDIPIENDPDKNLKKQELQQLIEGCLQCLSEKERTIIEKRYLSDEKTTLREIALDVELSGERVRQIEKKALTKLRNHIKSSKRKLNDVFQ